MHGLNMMRCSLSSIYCTYAYSWLQAMMAIWLLSKVD